MKKYVVSLLTLCFLATPSLAEVVTVKSKSVVSNHVLTVDEENFQLQLAVPGFSKSEFEIKLKGNLLTVSATPVKDSRSFFKKSFTQQFVLDKNAAVGKLVLADGILSISISKPLPPDQKTKSLSVE
jgi:HSP20 family molecular chaperone IbpA